ncbi:hypothetical protein [Paenibacillus sp. NPDC057934]|uniref:hypothetical protein n=1 Tax=Paenibacillus sp. NPDC057934 TaxID=3346282 RepID=UPI0036DBFA96
MNTQFYRRRGLSAWCLGLCAAALIGLTGCSTDAPALRYQEVNKLSTLDGELEHSPEPSPVLIDVYDRSIPQEVYSGD